MQNSSLDVNLQHLIVASKVFSASLLQPGPVLSVWEAWEPSSPQLSLANFIFFTPPQFSKLSQDFLINPRGSHLEQIF